MPDTNFDACGKKGIADAKEATVGNALMGSMARTATPRRMGQGCGLTTW